MLMDGYEALQRLVDGNARYVAANMTHANETAERRKEVAAGQNPFAVILGCSDSRVPAEIVFDQGLGDLIVVRVAGPVLDDAVLGSLEFAVGELKVRLILVLGHERCGAVTATVAALQQGTEVPGHINSLVDAIRPAVKRVQGWGGDTLDYAVRANVELLVERLRITRPILGEAVRQGTLMIVGARYDLDAGRVDIIVP
jgi:carbonic anhydrase